jgi:hypothetical protein
VLQAPLSVNVARALHAVRPQAYFINCCFADVLNPLIAALGLPITCGVGNVAILANAFAGAAALGPGRLKVLAHYQNLAPWRRPPETRSGPVARVWIDGEEVGDVYRRFAGVRLTREPAIEISGASGVPLMLAMASGRNWSGHAPGPRGLPGGYPVKLEAGEVDLDLPPSLTRNEAIAWNLRERLAAFSPGLAGGFHVDDLEEVHRDMSALRARLERDPA